MFSEESFVGEKKAWISSKEQGVQPRSRRSPRLLGDPWHEDRKEKKSKKGKPKGTRKKDKRKGIRRKGT